MRYNRAKWKRMCLKMLLKVLKKHLRKHNRSSKILGILMTEIKLLNKKLFSNYTRAIFGARVSPDSRKKRTFPGTSTRL